MKQAKNSKAKSKTTTKDNTARLFIDPASISSGWALFRGKELSDHGTVVVDKKLNVFPRLKLIYATYLTFSRLKFTSVHIEKMPRRVHHFTMWSVGVIGMALSLKNVKVDDDIPVRSWQKVTNWDNIKDDWKEFGCESQDEWAAIQMGNYYLKEKL